MENGIFSFPYTVDSAFIDGALRFTVIGMATMAQSLVSFHYGDNGLSIPHVAKKGYTWVVSKQRFEISTYPLWRDELLLTSWMQKPKGPFLQYDYEFGYAKDYGKKPDLNAPVLHKRVEDTAMGDVFFKASTQWLLLDVNTLRPVRMEGAEFDTLTYCQKEALGGRFQKIELPADFSYSAAFSPSRLDIDLNGHVNNIEYLRYIFSYIPPELLKEELLVTSLEAQYVSSAHFSDKLECRSAIVSGAGEGSAGEKSACKEITVVHQIVRDDHSEVFRARTTWVPAKTVSRPVIV